MAGRVILNYTTSIAVEKTVAEVTSLLSRGGVISVSTHMKDGIASGLSFAMQTEYGPREFQLPIKTNGVLAALKEARRKNPRVVANELQAARVAWRIAKDWLEVQLALVDAEMVKLDEVMLPWMISNEGGTMYELVVQQGRLELEGAK